MHQIKHNSYIRIRRKQQTFYVLCEPNVHDADHLKSEICTALAADAPEKDDMKLMDTAGDELSEDLSKLENEQELHVVFRISDDEYEPVDVRNADMTE
jgi:hypothetical protein